MITTELAAFNANPTDIVQLILARGLVFVDTVSYNDILMDIEQHISMDVVNNRFLVCYDDNFND